MLPSAWQTARLSIKDATHADQDVCHSCLAESQDTASLDPAFTMVEASEIEELIERSLSGAGAIDRAFQMQVFRHTSTGEAVGYWHFMAVPKKPSAVGVSIMLIRPAFRRQGLGREIISAAHPKFPASKRELWARVYLANPRAIEFWASLGFLQLVLLHDTYVSPPAEQPSIILSRQLSGGSDA